MTPLPRPFAFVASLASLWAHHREGMTGAVLAGLVALSACGGEGSLSDDGQDEAPGAGGVTAGSGGAGDGAGGTGASNMGGSGGTPSTGEPCATGTYDHDDDPWTVCQTWTACPPGQYVSQPGSATADQQCSGCPSGSFSTSANASECVDWATCGAGYRVRNDPSATEDRECAACSEGESTSGPNQSTCQPHDACTAGTEETAPGTSTSPPACAACDAGTYCAGGTEPAVACTEGTWDHDGDPATTCAARTTCVAGQYVSDEGDATTDRSCEACPEDTFSTIANEGSCTPWTECPEGYTEDTPASATSDRTCRAGEWFRQLGTSSEDHALSVSVGADGSVYAAGFTSDTLPGQSSAGNDDAFLVKYSGAGDLLWTRQFGSGGHDRVRSVSVDGSGDIYVAGEASGSLFGGQGVGAFLVKYSSEGNPLWARQFAPGASDIAFSVSIDGNGNAYVAGYTYGALPGQTNAGAEDAFLVKYNSAGTLLWARQFGSGGSDRVRAMSVEGGGHVFVAGFTRGTLPDQTSAGAEDAFLVKYNSAGNLLWTRQFGSSNYDSAYSVSVDDNGGVYVAGEAWSALPEQTKVGENDAFVRKYDSAGEVLWTRQFGTSSYDSAFSASVDSSGSVYVAGFANGALPDQLHVGSYDAFAMKYDSAGTLLWTRQFGTSNIDEAYAVSLDADGGVFLAGRTNGTLPDQTSSGGYDAFVARLVP